MLDSDVLARAVLRGVLSPEIADEALAEGRRLNTSAVELAVDSGVLPAVEADICYALSSPENYVPGYVVQSVLGRGTIGAVFRATKASTDQQVALKVVNLERYHDSRARRRCQQEAEIAARLDHPHVVTALDAGIVDNRFFLAMEILEGETLDEWISRAQPGDEAFAWAIAYQISAALKYATSHGVVHRDVKPSNIFLTNTTWSHPNYSRIPHAVLTDFGLALSIEAENRSRLTAAGTTLGTLCYIAPEQLEETHVDSSADIYALGATVYHVLTGRPPYANAKGITRLLVAKAAGNEKWREELPAFISRDGRELLLEMTVHDPGDRVSDYDELMDRIHAILESAGSAASEPPIKMTADSDATEADGILLTREHIIWAACVIAIAVVLIIVATVLL